MFFYSPTDICVVEGDQKEYASLRRFVQYQFAGETKYAMFVRWYERTEYRHPTRCQMVIFPAD